MNLIIKLVVYLLCLTVMFNVALASRRRTVRRNRTMRPDRRHRVRITTTTTTTTTEEPVEFPYPMLCISKKEHRAVAEEVTEKCCRKVGVACKQREHIGQPTEWDCITETHQQRRGMIKCCHKKKKTWRKGKVTDGIDCSHKNHKQEKDDQVIN